MTWMMLLVGAGYAFFGSLLLLNLARRRHAVAAVGMGTLMLVGALNMQVGASVTPCGSLGNRVGYGMPPLGMDAIDCQLAVFGIFVSRLRSGRVF